MCTHGRSLIPFLTALFVCLSMGAFAQGFSGKVVRVVDGDTFSVVRDGKPILVHLNGVDCPELMQTRGNAAREFTSKMILGKEVSVDVQGEGTDSSAYGDVALPSGRSLGGALLGAGLAWHDSRANADGAMAVLEQEARAGKRGVWGDPGPVAPWDYRAKNPAPSRSAMNSPAITSTIVDASVQKSTHGAATIAGTPDEVKANMPKQEYWVRKRPPRQTWAKPWGGNVAVLGTPVYGMTGGGGYGGNAGGYTGGTAGSSRQYGGILGGGSGASQASSPARGGGGYRAPVAASAPVAAAAGRSYGGGSAGMGAGGARTSSSAAPAAPAPRRRA